MKVPACTLGLVLATLVARGAAAPRPAEPAVGPRARFAGLVHDFGRMDAGSVVRHDFVFTNTGNAVLEIAGVRPGCGCTTAGTWDKRVEPGQTGRIPLQFNSTGFSGTVVKSAVVSCNDRTQSNVVLQLRATIWRPIDVNPASAYFHVSGEARTNETRVVRIVNNLEAPLTLSEPDCSNRSFRVALNTIKAGKEFELWLTVLPELLSTFVQGQVTLRTSSTNMPLLSIPVYANVQPVIQVTPSRITLPAGPLPGAIQPAVTVRNTGTNFLTLSEATINLPGAGVTLRELQPGRVFTVAVSVPAGVQLQSTQKVEVTLKSNHPKFPELRVPVLQQAQRRPVAAALVRAPETNGPAGGLRLVTP